MVVSPAHKDEVTRQSGEELPRWAPNDSRTARLIAGRDWRQTALGPIESWPVELTQTARLCLDSSFPFAIAWGPQRIQLYNDAFAALCGAKHPAALGQDMRQCWESAWPVLGPCFEQALAGHSAYIEDGRLYLDRAGKLEETFATFSFSPVRDRSQAAVAGVLLTIIETTGKVLAERRARLLRDVIAAAVGAASVQDALAASLQALDTATGDVPFALLYTIDAGGTEAELVARTQSAPEQCSPSRIELNDDRRAPPPWPVADVVAANRRQLLQDVGSRIGNLDCASHAEAPNSALVLPIARPDTPSPGAVLVVALSARLALDDEYIAFAERLASAISINWAGALAHEAQRVHVEQLARARHEHTAHLERANRELEAFSYSVSHDLRTPLRAIDGFSKALLTHKSALLDEEGQDYLRRVRRASERMATLIDELLNLSRLSRTPLDRHTISLSKLSEIVAANLSELEPNREVRFKVEGGLTAFADPRLLQIVLENLLENSWKFTKFQPEARVFVGRVANDDTPTYFVRDNGAGFDPSFVQHLFQPFQRLHLERDYPGTGIGLAIVHRIIARHGGRVWAEGQEQQGATFYFTLPDTLPPLSR
jgi:signal transduction histidine kinase